MKVSPISGWCAPVCFAAALNQPIDTANCAAADKNPGRLDSVGAPYAAAPKAQRGMTFRNKKFELSVTAGHLIVASAE
jgi:hypothetical protein